MLLFKYGNIDRLDELIEKYSDKINYIKYDEHSTDENFVINLIEDIKQSMVLYEITILDYMQALALCFDALSTEYSIIYNLNELENESEEFRSIEELKCYKFVIKDGIDLFRALSDNFEWINIEESVEINEVKEEEIEEINDIEKSLIQSEPRNRLTLEQLINDDITITEADVRDFKEIQNKLKLGVLLQAKNSLKRVLKLSNTLDKLYDSLLERIDQNLTTTDTASLMYTTEYIAKALNDTNQFIVSLINNEKIQNFFIIDNSTIINTSNDTIDLDKREKIRKAVDIVMNNIDYFTNGQFDKLQDPNIIEVNKEEENA